MLHVDGTGQTFLELVENLRARQEEVAEVVGRHLRIFAQERDARNLA